MIREKRSTATLAAAALAMAVAGAAGFMIALKAVPPADGATLHGPASAPAAGATCAACHAAARAR